MLIFLLAMLRRNQKFLGIEDFLLSTHTCTQRWGNIMLVLEGVSQSIVWTPTQVIFRIFLLLDCVPFLSSLWHFIPHLPRPLLPHSSSFLIQLVNSEQSLMMVILDFESMFFSWLQVQCYFACSILSYLYPLQLQFQDSIN